MISVPEILLVLLGLGSFVFSMQATLHDLALSTAPVFVGLFIIFVAWIMDEGWKIQAEQELTV